MDESKEKKSSMTDVILRVPGVVMLEMLYMETITLKNLKISSQPNHYMLQYIDIILYIIAWLLILLPQKSLLYFYSCFISFFSMVMSHYILRLFFIHSNILQNSTVFQLAHPSNATRQNLSWIQLILEEQKTFETSATVILIQLTLVLLSCKIINANSKTLVLLSSPLYPWLTCLFTSSTLQESMFFCYIISCLAVYFYYLKPLKLLSLHWRLKIFWIKLRLIVRIFGWQGVVIWVKDEYQVQRLLVTCWFLRYTLQLLANLLNSLDLRSFDQTVFSSLNIHLMDLFAGASIIPLLFFTAMQCLTTTINLFGLVCIVKDVIRFQYHLTRSWLHWSLKNHPPDSVSGPATGFIDGITLLIMTLYTDALNTYVEGRTVLMICILFTIASSQFQSMFNIVDPILMTLATAHNGSFWKHLRTVLFALILLIVSGIWSYISFFVMRSSFLVFIFAYNYVNTFSLMLGSLSIYFILMFDYLTLRGWTSLDDVMFYIRGACRAIEFCVTLGICGYIMTTFYAEMTSFLGIIMLAVYTYYCIVQRGGKGWRIWQMRRQAAVKVRSLPLASKESLSSKHDDLCPICYQALDNDVRIMHCNHFFHENCLKKWFYIQEKCPMCYAEFMPTAAKSDTSPEKENEKTDTEPQPNVEQEHVD